MYKIVSHKLESFMSEFLNLIGYGIQYEVNKFVYPHVENSKLFVFNHLEAALVFYNRNNCRPNFDRLFKCEVINPVKVTRRYIPTPSCQDYVDHFWQTNTIHGYNYNLTPEDTYFADAVKLTKEIINVAKLAKEWPYLKSEIVYG